MIFKVVRNADMQRPLQGSGRHISEACSGRFEPVRVRHYNYEGFWCETDKGQNC
jgi:hypothetical protein